MKPITLTHAVHEPDAALLLVTRGGAASARLFLVPRGVAGSEALMAEASPPLSAGGTRGGS